MESSVRVLHPKQKLFLGYNPIDQVPLPLQSHSGRSMAFACGRRCNYNHRVAARPAPACCRVRVPTLKLQLFRGANSMRCNRFANGKVVLASMARYAGKAAVNHSDVKDQACITMMCISPLILQPKLGRDCRMKVYVRCWQLVSYYIDSVRFER